MVVQKPLKVTLTNWEPGKVEWFDCPLNPAEPEGATRKVPFTGEFYIAARTSWRMLRRSSSASNQTERCA